MFLTKKGKIRKHLQSVDRGSWSAFDVLLDQYLTGELRSRLEEIGIGKLEIHVDYLEDYQCIGIQGKRGRYYIDIQIEESEFCLGCDPEEPDVHTYYPLENAEGLYRTVSDRIRELR